MQVFFRSSFDLIVLIRLIDYYNNDINNNKDIQYINMVAFFRTGLVQIVDDLSGKTTPIKERETKQISLTMADFSRR